LSGRWRDAAPLDTGRSRGVYPPTLSRHHRWGSLRQEAAMALNAYLSLATKKQGLIKGSVTQKGREGKIMVIAAEHAVSSPRDAATGQTTGKRVHAPFVVTKEIDASSTCLYAALVANEVFSTWELQFWAISPTNGAEVMRYAVRLVNAAVCDIRFHMPNNKHPELARLSEYEDVAFAYQKIEWLWALGGLKAGDDWMTQQRVAAVKRKVDGKTVVRSKSKKKT
jgi:type VI secretion system secreted protein Hcp